MSARVHADRTGEPADRAAYLLAHYLRTVWERAGLTWDIDNRSEVEEIVENLLAAARAASTDTTGGGA